MTALRSDGTRYARRPGASRQAFLKISSFWLFVCKLVRLLVLCCVSALNSDCCDRVGVGWDARVASGGRCAPGEIKNNFLLVICL